MAGKNTAVFGIYPNRPGVEYALGSLKDAGFRNADISVLLPENPHDPQDLPSQELSNTGKK